jgi:hypothetical protein
VESIAVSYWFLCAIVDEFLQCWTGARGDCSCGRRESELSTRALLLRKFVECDSINTKASAWSESRTENLEPQRNLLQYASRCIQQDALYDEDKGIVECKKDSKEQKKWEQFLTVD